MPTSNGKVVSVTPRQGLPAAAFFVFAMAISCSIPFLARQPKEVSAAVYSGYVSLMALVAVVAFRQKARRGAAVAAAVVCALFVGLLVVYAYLAFTAAA